MTGRGLADREPDEKIVRDRRYLDRNRAYKASMQKPQASLRALTSFLAAAALFGFSKEAFALDCASLPNPVYVPGTSLVRPFFAKVASFFEGKGE